jgi:transcriptional regulator with XRE-family HTH domain
MTTKKSKAMQLLDSLIGRPLTLNSLIESLRLSEEESQASFARRLKISPSHLCDIEKGRKLISPGRAARFARILGYSEEQFVRLSLQAIVDQAGLKYEVKVVGS